MSEIRSPNSDTIGNADVSAEVLAVFREISATLLKEQASSGLSGQQLVSLSKAYRVLLRASECIDWRTTSFSEWQSGISSLIQLLASEDKYVRHSAKKTLFLLGTYLEASTSAWGGLVEQLGDAAKMWMTGSAVPAPCGFGLSAGSSDRYNNRSATCKTMVEGTDSLQSGALVCSMGWTPTTCVLELHRCLLKNLVGKDECLVVFHRHLLRHTASMDCCYLKDDQSLSGGCVCMQRIGSLRTDTFPNIMRLCMTGNVSSSEELKNREGLLGSWLLLLSSVMRSLNLESCQSLTEGYRLQYICIKHINLLLPSLSDLALSLHEHRLEKHPSRHFLRHKLLTLMLKFAEWFAVDQTISITCMAILRSNAEDILRTSVLQHDVIELSQSCSSSPFSSCIAGTSGLDTKPSSSGHLHRRGLLLFFKLVSSGSRKRNLQVIEAATYLKLTPQEGEEAHVKEWVADLVFWLQDQLQAFGGAAANNVSLLSSSLADQLCISLLQLFVDEDDLLVEMLLQLSDLATILENYLVEPLTKETASAVSAIAPLRLYLAFLASIDYDASVLIDFLLSKQTGPLFLQYVMRGLRLIHDTWPQFLEYAPPVDIQIRNSSEASDSMRQLNSTLLSVNGAEACMSQLKCSIERLHQKHLFPYNPTPLLKRLRSFEKLMGSIQNL